MKITQYAKTGLGDKFQVELEAHAEQLVLDQIAAALREAARHYVDQNMDKITAKLDMAGLGNLIAIYAAKQLADTVRKEGRDA